MTVAWADPDLISERSTVRCWLPEAPDTKIGGVWSLVEGAAGMLELAGSFPSRIVGQDTFSTYDFIHIETVSVAKATLMICREVSSSGSLYGSRADRAQWLEVETVMWGAHLTLQDLEFNEAFFTTTGLAEWAFPGAFARFSTTVDQGHRRAEYTRPPITDAGLPFGRVQLIADALPQEAGESVNFDETVLVRVSWNEPQPWADVIRPVCSQVADLISFATRRPNPPAAMRASGPALANRDHPVSSRVRIVDADIRPAAQPFDRTSRVLFQLRQAPLGWERLLLSWIELQSEVGIVVDLLTGLRTTERDTLYATFFAAAQMLEGYHRAKVGGDRLSEEEYSAIKEKLRKACPADQMTWLDAFLSHGNDPSFKDRINALVARSGHIGRDITRLRRRFARNVMNYRNGYAHLLEPHDVPVERQLVDLIIASEWVMIGCVLQDLGWGDANAWGLVQNHPSYGRATRPLVPIE